MEKFNFSKVRCERIFKIMNGDFSPPFKMVLIPTNRCNLRCVFCPNSLPRIEGKFKRKNELSKENWKRIVDEGLKLKVCEWSIIGGGEPFLRKDVVMYIVSKVKKSSYPTDVEIITNGTLITKREVKQLVTLGLDRILFSIDAPTPSIHDSLRGARGAFQKVKRTVELFATYKRILKKRKPYLKINMVINSLNFHKIPEMVKFAKSIGVQELALHPMREYWEFIEEVKSLRIDGEQKKKLKEKLDEAVALSRKLGINLNLDMIRSEAGISVKNDGGGLRTVTISKKIHKTWCFEPFYSMLIDPEGNVAPCAPAGSGFKELNVKENSLRKIWLSEKLQHIRKILMKGKPLEWCKKCGLLDMRERIKNDLINFVGDDYEI